MVVELEKAGKRYRLEWIFKDLSCRFQTGERYAILGPNGSGKSTLLKVISGHLSPSKGHIQFSNGQKTLPVEDIFRQVAYAAPYIELIEEFTLAEALHFHAKMKPLLPGLNTDALLDLLQLPRARNKEIRFFSSGMKQRVKLALAICSDTPALLLDEPATNLDVQGVEWYKRMIQDFAASRLVVIASNDPHDAAFCPTHLNIMDYKGRNIR